MGGDHIFHYIFVMPAKVTGRRSGHNIREFLKKSKIKTSKIHILLISSLVIFFVCVCFVFLINRGRTEPWMQAVQSVVWLTSQASMPPNWAQLWRHGRDVQVSSLLHRCVFHMWFLHANVCDDNCRSPVQVPWLWVCQFLQSESKTTTKTQNIY